MQALRPALTRLLLSAALGLSSVVAHAQGAATDAGKQALIDRILVLFHPENAVLIAVQRPAKETMQKSAIALQTAHVPKERVDKALKDISTDVQKYIDTATPLAAASAKKNVGPAVGPIFAENFTVDELRQILALLESPVKAKFEKLVPRMEDAVGQKVQAEVAPQINKDIQAMNESAGTKLRVAATLN
jgi:uncharacterized protein